MKPIALVIVPLEKGYLVSPLDNLQFVDPSFLGSATACSKLGGSYSLDRGTVLEAVEAHFNPPTSEASS